MLPVVDGPKAILTPVTLLGNGLTGWGGGGGETPATLNRPRIFQRR